MPLRNDTVVHVWKWWEGVQPGAADPLCPSLSQGCPGAAAAARSGDAGWAPELRRVTGKVRSGDPAVVHPTFLSSFQTRGKAETGTLLGLVLNGECKKHYPRSSFTNTVW